MAARQSSSSLLQIPSEETHILGPSKRGRHGHLEDNPEEHPGDCEQLLGRVPLLAVLFGVYVLPETYSFGFFWVWICFRAWLDSRTFQMSVFGEFWYNFTFFNVVVDSGRLLLENVSHSAQCLARQWIQHLRQFTELLRPLVPGSHLFCAVCC